MDPLTTLNNLRELASDIMNPNVEIKSATEAMENMAEQFQALDEWMKKGGFSPWPKPTEKWSFELVNAPEHCDSEDDMIGWCRIASVDFHMTFIAVEEDGEGEQRPVSGHSRYGALQDFEDVADDFLTVEVDGKDFVLVLTPFTA